MSTSLLLNPGAKAPLHRQIYDAWRRAILEGRFAAGDRVPSSRELAGSLGVSRSTVAQAYEQLVAEGYLHARRGSGTYVSDQLPDDLRPAARRPAPGRADGGRWRLSRLGDRLAAADDVPGTGERAAALPAGVIRFSQVTPVGEPAGMHVRVSFDDLEVARRAAAAAVQLGDASAYYLCEPPDATFLMGFAALGERVIREGVRRLAGEREC